MHTTKIRLLGTVMVGAVLPYSCLAGEITKVLHFPADQYVGRLSVEDPCLGSEFFELGRDVSYPFGFDPKCVRLAGDWDFVALAHGDVGVPAGRNVRLIVSLGHGPADAAKLARLPARQYQMCVAGRCRSDPNDLTGLSRLGPDDLYMLSVQSLIRRADADRRVLKPISHLTGLQVLELHGTGVTDKQMKHLLSLPSLRALGLHQEPSLRNSGLAVLKALPALEYLDLDAGTTDVGLKHVGQLANLRWLRVTTGKFYGAGLAELANAPRLERLALWGSTGLSDRHISYLEGLTRLKSLTLWGGACRGLGDATLASIGKLTSLEELHFIRAETQFTDAGVAHLKGLKHLREVGFGFSQVGAAGLRHLAALPNLEAIHDVVLSTESVEALAAFDHLKSLSIGMMTPPLRMSVPREDISGLARLRSLEELRMGGRRWGEADLVFLKSLPNLRRLFLSSRDVTDDTIGFIAGLKKLEYLSLNGTRLTKRGLNRLNALTNLRTLDVSVDFRQEIAVDETPLDLSGLTNLQTLELERFWMQDGDLASLGRLRNLEWLVLPNGPRSEGGLRHLKDLTRLKNLYFDDLALPTGVGLSQWGGLTSLRDLKLSGTITDGALRQLPILPGLWSLTVETEEIIQPETIAKIQARLPAVDYVHVREPRQIGGPRPVRVRGSDGRGPSESSRSKRSVPSGRRRR